MMKLSSLPDRALYQRCEGEASFIRVIVKSVVKVTNWSLNRSFTSLCNFVVLAQDWLRDSYPKMPSALDICGVGKKPASSGPRAV